MSAHKPRILVIDDEPQIHRFLGPALDAAGYECARADSAAEGLREIARKAPDVVVLDLGLPDLDGKEALAKARAFYDGPIIILSARDRETEKIDALDLGADDYVEKPFGVGELLARIRAALRHRLRDGGSEPVVTSGDLIIDLIAWSPARVFPSACRRANTTCWPSWSRARARWSPTASCSPPSGVPPTSRMCSTCGSSSASCARRSRRIRRRRC
jgi:CheY-like chemotaxis protein